MITEDQKFQLHMAHITQCITPAYYAHTILRYQQTTPEECQEFFNSIIDIEKEAERLRFQRYWVVQQALLYSPN